MRDILNLRGYAPPVCQDKHKGDSKEMADRKFKEVTLPPTTQRHILGAVFTMRALWGGL